MARDQFARNEASYRPNTLRADREYLSAAETSRFVADLWELAEPGNRPFERLDNHLFRLAAERAYKGAHGAAADLLAPAYRADIETLVDQQGLVQTHHERVVGFLMRDTSPDDPELLKAATTRSRAINVSHHLHATARAALMLRVATGAARQMLDNAGIGAPLLDFWWQQLASSRSICDVQTPEELLDTWADVTDAIDQVAAFLTDNADPSFIELSAAERSAALHTLARLELAGLVGLLA